MLTLMDYFSPAHVRVYSRKILGINNFKNRIRTVISTIPREMCVQVLNGTIACWLLCAKYDGEQVETIP